MTQPPQLAVAAPEATNGDTLISGLLTALAAPGLFTAGALKGPNGGRFRPASDWEKVGEYLSAAAKNHGRST